MSKEKRFIENIEVRKLDDGSEVIEGYAIVFDSDSRNLGGFIERIDPNALEGADVSDVVALLNHDNNLVLGRTSDTLKLSVDERGLKYTIYPPDTTIAQDTVKSIKRGDIRGSSFQFTVAKGGDVWREPQESGQLWERKIKHIAKLYDVSPVTFPAYEATDTTIAKRELGIMRDKKEKETNDKLEEQKKELALRNRQQEKLKLNLKLAAKLYNIKEDDNDDN